MVFQTNYDEIELQKISYDVISVTSSSITSRKFSILPPSLIKNFGYAIEPKQFQKVLLMLHCCILLRIIDVAFRFLTITKKKLLTSL